MDNLWELIIGAGFFIVMSLIGGISKNKKKASTTASKKQGVPNAFPSSYPNQEEPISKPSNHQDRDVFAHEKLKKTTEKQEIKKYFTYEDVDESFLKEKPIPFVKKAEGKENMEKEDELIEGFDLKRAIIYSALLNNPYKD